MTLNEIQAVSAGIDKKSIIELIASGIMLITALVISCFWLGSPDKGNKKDEGLKMLHECTISGIYQGMKPYNAQG